MLFVTGSHETQIGQKIGQWFSEKQKLPVTPPYSAICWGNEKHIVSAAVFNDFNGACVEVHFYGPAGLTRQVISNIVHYVFIQLECNTLIARIPRNNNFKKYMTRIGFKYLAIIPNYFGPTKQDDAILYYMQKEQAKKWMKNGKYSHAAASPIARATYSVADGAE